MPRNSSGVYVPPPGTAAVSNTPIGSVPYNSLVADIGNELTGSLPVSGAAGMVANLPMNSHKIVGLADPTVSTDGMTKNYADTNYATIAFGTRFVGGTSTGTASAQVLATTVPNTFALTAGNTVVFSPGFNAVAGAATLQVGGTAATNFLKRSPTGPVNFAGGEFVANQNTSATFDGTQFLLNTPSGNILTPTSIIDSGTLALTGVISPSALAAGGTNDYNPTGLATASTIRITPDPTTSYLTGLTAQPAGTIVIITNIGTGNLILIGQSASSLAANRFLIAAPLRIFPGQSAALQYDATSTGWQSLQAQLASPPTAARKNLKIVTTSVTAATITADELVLAGPTASQQFWLSNINVSYATGTSGANGLDTGTIAASTWYYEWVIYNPATLTTAALISLSSTAPTMPAGYTFKARVGASYFDAGSKLRFKVQYDRRVQYVIGTNPATSIIMSSGSQGNPDTPTYLAVSTATFAPPTASVIWLGTYKGNNQRIIVAPNASYGSDGSSTNPPFLSQDSTNEHADNRAASLSMVLESANIYWASSGGSTLIAQGYEDNL